MQPEDKKLRHLERRRRRYAEDAVFRERILQSNRRYWLANQERIKAQRRHKWATEPDYRLKARLRWRPITARKSKLKRLYGLSLKDYAALLERQNGLCLICKRKPKDALCVDHCHSARVVRELLCRKCNLGLGCFNHHPRLLRAAAEYLKKHRLLANGPKMAITNYTELKTAVETWLDHTLFTARVPDFIALFEAAANRRLRVRQQEATAMLTPSAGAVALPADYLAWRRVTWIGSPRVELEYAHPSYLQAVYPTSPADVPRFFTIEGSALKVRPIDNAALEFDYFQKIAALSDGAPTNWLLAAHPDLYLFGSLTEAEMFGVNDERAPLWKGRRDEIFDEIEKLSNKTRGAGAARVMGPTP